MCYYMLIIFDYVRKVCSLVGLEVDLKNLELGILGEPRRKLRCLEVKAANMADFKVSTYVLACMLSGLYR